ncbi:YrpD family protein [Paenibacillus donghaensis]
MPQGDAGGTVTGSFANILIDSAASTPVLNSTDFANVSISGNNTTITVSK